MTDGFWRFKIELITEFTNNSLQIEQFFLVGFIVDSIYKSFLLLTDKFCYLSVCQQHKFLNQMIGIFRLFEIYPNRVIFFIETKLHFYFIKRNRPMCHSLCSQLHRKII